MAGGVAAKELDLAAAAVQFFGQQAEEGLVGGGIHRWGGDPDAEFLPQGAEDFIGGRPGLQFDGEQEAVRMQTEVPSRSGGRRRV